jgi:hypothetical protein
VIAATRGDRALWKGIYKIAAAPTSNLYAVDHILIGAAGFDREAVR